MVPYPTSEFPSVTEDEDPEELEFVGAFVADASPDDAAWISTAPDPDDFANTAVGASVHDSFNDEEWYDSHSWDSINIKHNTFYPYSVPDYDTTMFFDASDGSSASTYDSTLAGDDHRISLPSTLLVTCLTWFLFSTSQYYRCSLAVVHNWRRLLHYGVAILLHPLLLISFYISILS